MKHVTFQCINLTNIQSVYLFSVTLNYEYETYYLTCI